ncbi:hypothetical protein ABPG72_006168 [Tetrahymena utriculariae]
MKDTFMQISTLLIKYKVNIKGDIISAITFLPSQCCQSRNQFIILLKNSFMYKMYINDNQSKYITLTIQKHVFHLDPKKCFTKSSIVLQFWLSLLMQIQDALSVITAEITSSIKDQNIPLLIKKVGNDILPITIVKLIVEIKFYGI